MVLYDSLATYLSDICPDGLDAALNGFPVKRVGAVGVFFLNRLRGPRPVFGDLTTSVPVHSMAGEGKTSPRPARRKRRKVVINLSNCRYAVLEEAALALNWTVTRDDKVVWDLYWTDMSVSEERLLKLKKSQRINHFVGMHTLARKTSMARLLRRISSHIPSAFTFVPQTWILPNEGGDLKKKSKEAPRWVIVKPDGSCQGKGIFLTNSAEKACSLSPAAVAQEYVASPFLIDGFKFDIRIYVLVTSCDPLRVYLYEEGLARFCTRTYCAPSEENAKQSIMHLTNYAINKKQENFQCSEDGTSGFKRTLTSVWQWLDEHGHSSKDVIDSISRLCVATLLAAQPALLSVASNLNITSRDDRGLASFELLGFDVLLDSNLKPWLLEVNHSPSFACESDMDKRIKTQLLTDTLSILHVSTRQFRWQKIKDKSEAAMRLNGVPPRPAPPDEGERIRLMRVRHEERNPGGFARIFPAPLGTPEADLYQEVAAAAWRAHEQGEVKQVVIPKSPLASTDSLRPQSSRCAGGGSGGGAAGASGASDWRARASLSQVNSSQSPASSPLPANVVGSSSPWYRCVSGVGGSGGSGGRRRVAGDGASANCSLSVGGSARFRSLEQGAASSQRGLLDEDSEYMRGQSPLHASPPGCRSGGLAGLRSRLRSSAGLRLGPAEAGGEGTTRIATLRQSLGGGIGGSPGTLPVFAGEGWADVLPLPSVSHRAKRFRLQSQDL